MIVALAVLFVQLPPDETAQQRLRARVELAPHDVKNFIERRADCNHFEGEISGDAELDRHVNDTLRQLRCDQIERDERRLRLKYHGKSTVRKLLRETLDLIPW